METTLVQKRLILVGAISGILAALIYPVIYYSDISFRVDVILDLIFGFAMGFISYGLYRFIRINRDSVSLQVGVFTGILAAFSYLLKSSILLAVNAPLEGILVQGDQSFVYGLTNRLHIGVEFLWEILIGVSILTFSFAFFRQPRPGKVISVAGIAFSLAIIISAIITFPEAPANYLFTDMGTALPVWHLVVSLLLVFSLKWIKVKDDKTLP